MPANDARRILLIGGVDPCGGAGITADARMVQARGAFPLTVPACLTVQNRLGLDAVHAVDPGLLEGMLAAVLEDGVVHACKLGLLGDAGLAELIADMIAPLRDRGVPIVVDPVLGATAGGWNASNRLLDVYRNALAPLADLLTPNLEEIERLAPAGPRELLDRGCRAVLVKGGHAAEDPVEDRLWALAGDSVFRHPRLDVGPVHGTGCALATAIACGLARGDGVEVATRAGVTVLHRCLVATTRGRDGHPVPLAIV